MFAPENTKKVRYPSQYIIFSNKNKKLYVDSLYETKFGKICKFNIDAESFFTYELMNKCIEALKNLPTPWNTFTFEIDNTKDFYDFDWTELFEEE